MKYKLPVTDKTYFRVLLGILKPFPPFNKLSPREAEAYGLLLYYNNKYKELDSETRMKLIFNQDTRAEMVQEMDVSKPSLYNLFKDLRNKGFITLNSINPKYMFYPDKHKQLIFDFNINAKSDIQNND